MDISHILSGIMITVGAASVIALAKTCIDVAVIKKDIDAIAELIGTERAKARLKRRIK